MQEGSNESVSMNFNKAIPTAVLFLFATLCAVILVPPEVPSTRVTANDTRTLPLLVLSSLAKQTFVAAS